jgi:hypothetical protein
MARCARSTRVTVAAIAVALVLGACGGSPVTTAGPSTVRPCPPSTSGLAANSISGDELSYLSEPLLTRSAWLEISALSDQTPPDYGDRAGHWEEQHLVAGDLRVLRAETPDLDASTFAPGFLLRAEVEETIRSALGEHATVILSVTPTVKDGMFAGRFPTALFPDGTVRQGNTCLKAIGSLTAKAAQEGRSEADIVRGLVVAGPQPQSNLTTRAWIDQVSSPAG